MFDKKPWYTTPTKGISSETDKNSRGQIKAVNCNFVDWRQSHSRKSHILGIKSCIVKGRVKKTEESVTLVMFFATQKPFVCLQEAPKQTLCSLLTSDMLDIASNSVLKASCAISDTSVVDTRKW